MTEAEAKEAIAQRFKATWEAAYPGVPYALSNEAVMPPSTTTLFAALSFGPIQDRQLTQGPSGTRRFECRATVTVRLFGPVDGGENFLALVAGTVRASLASQTIPGAGGQELVAMSASSTVARSAGWWTNTVVVPFRYYDRR